MKSKQYYLVLFLLSVLLSISSFVLPVYATTMTISPEEPKVCQIVTATVENLPSGANYVNFRWIWTNIVQRDVDKTVVSGKATDECKIDKEGWWTVEAWIEDANHKLLDYVAKSFYATDTCVPEFPLNSAMYITTIPLLFYILLKRKCIKLQ